MMVWIYLRFIAIKQMSMMLNYFLKDQPLLSFEDALDRSSPYIYQLLSDSVRESVDTYIYATELVYMTVRKYDLGNVSRPHDRHSVSDNFEMYY